MKLNLILRPNKLLQPYLQALDCARKANSGDTRTFTFFRVQQYVAYGDTIVQVPDVAKALGTNRKEGVRPS